MVPSGLDIAWYYSSLSQVSASIVGLIGGILISRLIDHMSVMRQKLVPLENEISGVRSDFSGFYANITDLETYFLSELNEYSRCISLSTTRVVSSWKDFGSSGSGSPILQTVDDMKARYKEIKRKSDAAKILEENKNCYLLEGEVTPISVRLLINNFKEVSAKLESTDQKALDVVKNHCSSLERLYTHVIDFKSKLIPKHIVIVIILLTIISIFGIILPLRSLPGFDQKIYMLNFFTFALISLMFYFCYHLYELYSIGKLSWNQKK